MLKLLEGHLPHVIDWLVDEHGEVIVASTQSTEK